VIDIPTDLPAELVPLSWLIGVWEGTGVIDYGEHSLTGEFTHRVSFSHDGGDYLNYSAEAWLHDAEGSGSRTRLVAEDIERLRNADGGFDIEAALVHADGVSELYLGQIKGPRIDIATDAVVRPAGAKNYAAATRMYGLVDGHLLWAWDIAALGYELAAHASARLARAD
jgi:hypothetical protein